MSGTSRCRWTYVVTSNGEGTNSRVALTFTLPGTTHRVDVRIRAI